MYYTRLINSCVAKSVKIITMKCDRDDMHVTGDMLVSVATGSSSLTG